MLLPRLYYWFDKIKNFLPIPDKVPEIVPFRLTRNIVDGCGTLKLEGTFRSAAIMTMEIARQNADMLQTVFLQHTLTFRTSFRSFRCFWMIQQWTGTIIEFKEVKNVIKDVPIGERRQT